MKLIWAPVSAPLALLAHTRVLTPILKGGTRPPFPHLSVGVARACARTIW